MGKEADDVNHLPQTVAFALVLALPAVLTAQAADTPELAPAVQRQRDVRNAIADIRQKLLLLVRFEQDPDVKLKAAAAQRMLRDTALIGQSEQVADLLRRKRFAKALDGQKELVDTLTELLDLLSRAAKRAGQVIELQPREFRLLEYLMRNAGQVVTRTMLLEHVWDYHFDPQTNVIDVHISRLRQKIDKGFEKPLLHTVRGAGYRLTENG